MDRVEEIKGTYFYRGIPNLSAEELFSRFFPDTVNEQFGTSDIVAVACIIPGRLVRPTRGKFGGATKRASIASVA